MPNDIKQEWSLKRMQDIREALLPLDVIREAMDLTMPGSCGQVVLNINEAKLSSFEVKKHCRIK